MLVDVPRECWSRAIFGNEHHVVFVGDADGLGEGPLGHVNPPQKHGRGGEGERHLEQKEVIFDFADIGDRFHGQLRVPCLHYNRRFPIRKSRAIMHPHCMCLVDEKWMHSRSTEVAAHDSLLLFAPGAQTHGHVPPQGIYPANKVNQSPRLGLELRWLVQVEVKITSGNVGNLQVF